MFGHVSCWDRRFTGAPVDTFRVSEEFTQARVSLDEAANVLLLPLGYGVECWDLRTHASIAFIPTQLSYQQIGLGEHWLIDGKSLHRPGFWDMTGPRSREMQLISPL